MSKLERSLRKNVSEPRCSLTDGSANAPESVIGSFVKLNTYLLKSLHIKTVIQSKIFVPDQ